MGCVNLDEKVSFLSLRKRPVVLFSWLVPFFSLHFCQSLLRKKKKEEKVGI